MSPMQVYVGFRDIIEETDLNPLRSTPSPTNARASRRRRTIVVGSKSSDALDDWSSSAGAVGAGAVTGTVGVSSGTAALTGPSGSAAFVSVSDNVASDELTCSACYAKLRLNDIQCSYHGVLGSTPGQIK